MNSPEQAPVRCCELKSGRNAENESLRRKKLSVRLRIYGGDIQRNVMIFAQLGHAVLFQFFSKAGMELPSRP